MTGTAPTVALSVTPTGTVAPGTQITATLTITDPDTVTETLPAGPDSLGRTDTVTISRVDPEFVVWALDGVQISAGPSTLTFPAPPASAALTATVTDGQGNQAVATYAITVQPPLIVGDAYAVDLKRYPRQGGGIAFNQPAKGLSLAKTAAIPASMLSLTCFKDNPTPALVNPWLDAVTTPRWLCFHQEPEGDGPSADYIAGQHALADIIAAHRNAKLVTQIGKLTYYAEEHGKGPWQTWWAGTKAKPVEKVMGVDVYWSDPTARAYPDPAVLFADPIAWAAAAGVPLAITEFGLQQLPWDMDGSALAVALAAHVRYLRGRAILVFYWDGQGTKFNYALTGKAAAAWQAATAGQ